MSSGQIIFLGRAGKGLAEKIRRALAETTGAPTMERIQRVETMLAEIHVEGTYRNQGGDVSVEDFKIRTSHIAAWLKRQSAIILQRHVKDPSRYAPTPEHLTSTLADYVRGEYTEDSLEWRLLQRLELVMRGKGPEWFKQSWGEGASEDARGLLSYMSFPGSQTEFHASRAMIRAIMGANGAGKSLPTDAALVWECLTGEQLGRLPVHAWVVRPSFAINVETDPFYIRTWFGDEKFAPFIPRKMQNGKLKSRKRLAQITNGSTIEMRTWHQGAELQQGYEPDVIMIDEECPEALFQEFQARMLRKERGFMLCALLETTQPWTGRLIDLAEKSPEAASVHIVSARDNPTISKKRLKIVEDGMDEVEAAMRIDGKLQTLSGKVYSDWSEENWKDGHDLPDDRTDHVVIDIGIDRPCAALWCGRAAKEKRADQEFSDFWLHREYYVRNVADVRRHVEGILAAGEGLHPASWWIDPWSASNRVTTTDGRTAALRILDQWREVMGQYGIEIEPVSITRRLERLNRFLETRLWVKTAERSRPNVYALRRLVRFRSELLGYSCRGLVLASGAKGRSDQEGVFQGPNHLIFGMECAIAMDLPYLGKTAAAAIESSDPAAARSKRWWEEFGQPSPSGALDAWTMPDITAEAAPGRI